MITVVILAYNEQKHLARCIESVKAIAQQIVVVDCHSTDSTKIIACEYNAIYLNKTWINHAEQFNWALSQLKDANWILRIDADEVLTPELSSQITTKLSLLPSDVNGVYLNRRIKFLGTPIKYGGIFPIKVLRLFRYGHGKCENRWMDEHIIVNGSVSYFSGELVDDNLNSLTWWISKHNRYASLEAIEMLNLEHGFMHATQRVESQLSGIPYSKRWIKNNVYSKLPCGIRASMYFFYRYFVRLGFLDGYRGSAFHILQGFWYRYLVDLKVSEVNYYSKKNKTSIVKSIEAVLDVSL